MLICKTRYYYVNHKPFVNLAHLLPFYYIFDLNKIKRTKTDTKFFSGNDYIENNKDKNKIW